MVEVRHESFLDPAFVALLRNAGIAAVFSDHATYPAIADLTADFVYLRLQKGEDSIPTAYPPAALDLGRAARTFGGRRARDLPCVDPTSAAARRRATCSPTSFTKARSARRPPRWR